MTYDEWEKLEGISPSSPEAYYAERAWHAALKAQQVGQEPVAGGVCVTSCRSEEGITVGLVDTIINSARLLSNRNLGGAAAEALRDMRSDSDVCGLFTSAPQPAPAQDVAGLVELLRKARIELGAFPASEWYDAAFIVQIDAALAAHDKQSGVE